MEPTYNNNDDSSSDGNEEGESDLDWDLGASTDVLTQRSEGEGGGGLPRRHAGSFRVELSNRDQQRLADLESEERYTHPHIHTHSLCLSVSLFLHDSFMYRNVL